MAVLIPPLVDGRPHVGELIERIGVGWAQVRAGIVGGGVWLADGAELLLIASVARAISEEWGMSPLARGFIVSIVFCGIFIGNVVSGPLGDAYGRRHLIVVSYLCIFVFSICSALSTSVVVLGSVRMLVGISIGLGQPAWMSLGLEITPAYWRGVVMGAGQCLFSVGEIWSTVLLMADDPSLSHVHWRWLLFLGAIPSGVLFLCSLVFLHQSPSFLAVQGRRDEAMAVLKSMRDSNSAGDFSVDFQDVWPDHQKRHEQAKPWYSDWSLVFNQRFGATTLIVMFSCFTLNFCYIGSIYAFPQVLTNLEMGGSPAMQLMLGAVVEIPGYMTAIFLVTVMPRKGNMKFSLTFIVGALFSFMIGIQHLQSWLGLLLATAGYYGIKFFVPTYFVVCYMYSGEVFPAEIRITGSSVCLASGRFAAMIAPVAYEAICSFAKRGGTEAFFMMLLGLVMANAALIDLLPFETFGKRLEVCVHADGAKGDA